MYALTRMMAEAIDEILKVFLVFILFPLVKYGEAYCLKLNKFHYHNIKIELKRYCTTLFIYFSILLMHKKVVL